MRPKYGDFLRYDRVLNVFFYTSNTEKLLQARLIFVRHGHPLKHFRSRREPYDEDYSLGTEELLARAIKQVSADFRLRSIFFVEDTSLRVEALSNASDFPGLGVKEWFTKNSFQSVDKELRRLGGDRRATVKSDIGLHIPTLKRPIFVHGETTGEIAPSPPDFPPSPQYPWLTPRTFNGWFIPDGSTKRLGEMEFEESMQYDFRVKSLGMLLERLEELNSAINLSPTYYNIRRPVPEHTETQLPFLGNGTQVLLVIGPKCAGKTTLGDYLASSHEEVHVIEASTVLRGLAEEAGQSVNNGQKALKFLKRHGMEIVATKICEYIDRVGTRLNVVTGLRTIEELLFVMQRFPQSNVALVNSDVRLRFERHLRRARDTEIDTFRDFEEQDREQEAFGALSVASDLATYTLTNDTSIPEYHVKIDELVASIGKVQRARAATQPIRNAIRPEGELHRCLRALQTLGRTATCDEISAETSRSGSAVRRYNTNRALKRVPDMAERVEKKHSLLSYRLAEKGRILLQLLDEAAKRREIVGKHS
jgi:inosine/xanthosine triphosphate pyrophosphatase family protein/dephospho-CoA kinase